MSIWRWLRGSKISYSQTTGVMRQLTSNPNARIQWREGSYPMDAVGESHYQRELAQICGGHSRHGHEIEADAHLTREPNNQFDKNAVAVSIQGHVVAYLPREQAARIASQMIEDGLKSATCAAKIVGGWRTNQHDEGHFGVRLAIPRHGWIDFGIGKQQPSKSIPTPKDTRQKEPLKPATKGPLVGEWVVVWGAEKQGREAKVLAALGAKIMSDVGKSTTMVVYMDDELTPGMRSSATFRKVEELMETGQRLELISLRSLRDRLKG